MEQAHHTQSCEQANNDAHKREDSLALAGLRCTAEDLQAASGDGDPSGQGWSKPHLVLSSSAGIVATTPASAVFYGGNTCSITAGHDINFAAQGSYCHLVTKGINLFSYGKAGVKGSPNQETGIKLHAASGKVSIQSQSGSTHIAAEKTVTVTSVTKSVNVQALDHVLLTALGAFIKLEGGNIELCAPGKIEFKAGMKELAGPKAADVPLGESPSSSVKGCAQATADASANQAGAQPL